MADKSRKQPRSEPLGEHGLRTQGMTGPPTHDMKRFDIFLIDTGWNAAISKIVRTNLHVWIESYKQDSLYELSPEQSVEIIKHDKFKLKFDEMGRFTEYDD